MKEFSGKFAYRIDQSHVSSSSALLIVHAWHVPRVQSIETVFIASIHKKNEGEKTKIPKKSVKTEFKRGAPLDRFHEIQKKMFTSGRKCCSFFICQWRFLLFKTKQGLVKNLERWQFEPSRIDSQCTSAVKIELDPHFVGRIYFL